MRPFTALRSLLASTFETPRSRRNAVIAGVSFVLIWVTFFDSHSLLRRARWQMEYRALVEENARLQVEIDSVSSAIEAGLTDEIVEQIAREEYGMRRPGETVYRIKETE
ncbi:MAG: septum formation initiator family protein [Rhodothermales bacterium]